MAYQYDVFLSYSRDYPLGNWVDEMFYPLFKSYLNDALNADVRIFKDVQEIRSGQDWTQRIKSALVHSKVMVSILSPAYFRSEWCMREFAVMDHRQRTLGYLSDQRPSSLIVPLRLNDGKHYPSHVHKLEMLDCTSYYRVGEAVKQTNLFIDLQGLLLDWAEDVAYAIQQSPAFNANWSDANWIEEPYQKIALTTIPENIAAPKL